MNQKKDQPNEKYKKGQKKLKNNSIFSFKQYKKLKKEI